MKIKRSNKQSANNSLVTVLDDFVVIGNFSHYSLNGEKNKYIQRLGLMPHYVVKREDWEYGKKLMNVENNTEVLLSWLYNDGIHDFPVYICVTEDYLYQYTNELSHATLAMEFGNPIQAIEEGNLNLLLAPEYFFTQKELFIYEDKRTQCSSYVPFVNFFIQDTSNKSNVINFEPVDNFIFYNPKSEKDDYYNQYNPHENMLFASNQGLIEYDTRKSSLIGVDINAAHFIIYKNVNDKYVNRKFFAQVVSPNAKMFSTSKINNQWKNIKDEVNNELEMQPISYWGGEEFIGTTILSLSVSDRKFIDIVRNYEEDNKVTSYSYIIKKKLAEVLHKYGILNPDDIKVSE
jgi:hypothetical protein